MSQARSGTSSGISSPNGILLRGAMSTSLTIATFHIPGYHFNTTTTPSLGHGEHVDIVRGYRIADQQSVVAKVAASSLRLEREFYIMKRLYCLPDGPSYLVRPLENIHLPSGLTVAIYADGRANNAASLDDDIGNHKQTRYDGDLGSFLRSCIRCLDCLDFIHRHRVFHGEINLSAFQTSSSWFGLQDVSDIKLWNFGTRSLETYLSSEGWKKMTATPYNRGMLLDVLVYMSPEQTGRTSHSPDHRSDIYSLGIVFFVLLTGRLPFEGGPLEMLNGVLSRKIPLVHELQLDIPEAVSFIIEKMTNKAPGDRYSSVHGVRADIKRCLLELGATNEESIPAFPLAQHDIASVFTLPNTVYGCHHIISELKYIIERYVCLNKSSPLPATSTSPPSSSSHHRPQRQQLQLQRHPVDRSVGSGHAAPVAAAVLTLHRHEEEPVDDDDDDAAGLTRTATISSSCDGYSSHPRQTSHAKETATIVSVYGQGGVGKSTVISMVLATARQNGYVASTKFDSRNKVPYDGILRTLSQILQQILSESEEAIGLFQEHLKHHLGAHFSAVELLADFVPELRTLLLDASKPIGETTQQKAASFPASEEIAMDHVESRARFHNLFIEVFRALTHWRLMTLFLDDLHHADEPSLGLLEALILSRVKILIFITYRDQEVSGKIAQLLNADLATIHFIRIDPLNMECLVDYICDTLNRSKDTDRTAVQPLAEVIYKKTGGNAFYTAQLLKTLERKKLIYFDWELNAWDYSLGEIHSSFVGDEDGTDNPVTSSPSLVLDVSFLVARLRELPKNGQILLKYASFVGDTFSWKTIKNLMLRSDHADDDGNEEDAAAAAAITTTPSDAGGALTTISDDPDELLSSSTTDECNNPDAVDHHNQIYNADEQSHSKLRARLCAKQEPTEIFRRKGVSSSSSSGRDPMSGLQAVLQEGYILPIENDEFRWSHDRISQAAMELANPKSRGRIHFRIAKYLMNEATIDTFLVADHLLKCMEVILALGDDDADPYRRILIVAGNKGRSSGAHSMAFQYYMAAIEATCKTDPLRCWRDDNEYPQTLQLYTNAVSISWVVGEYERTQELLAALFEHTRHPIDRIPAFRMQAKYFLGQTMHDKARDALLRCLYQNGYVDFNFDVTHDDLVREFEELDELIARIGIENISYIGPCEDPLFKTIMGVVEELLTVAYWTGQQRELFYSAARILKLSIQKGMTIASGIGCMFIAIGYVQVFKRCTDGERMGMLGIMLTDKYGTNHERGRTYFLYAALLNQWKHHQREAKQWFHSGLELSRYAGDRIYSHYHQLYIGLSKFILGYNLADCLFDLETCYEDIHAWSTSVDTNTLAMAVIRAIKALQGRTFTDTPQVFDGDDGFNDEHFVTESCRHSSNLDVPMNWYNSFKMITLVLYGHTEVAIQVGYQCFETFQYHPCHRHTRMMLHYFSLALIDKARDLEITSTSDEALKSKKAELIAQARANQAILYEWSEFSPINYAMYWTLVEAELTSLVEPVNIEKASRLYEDAIAQARQGQWFLELCVIHEYTGAFYDRVGIKNVACGFINKAISLYTEHGSYGKASHLSRKYHELIQMCNDTRRESRDEGVQTDAYPYLGLHDDSWSTSSLSNSVPVHNEVSVSTPISPATAEQTLMTLDILDLASILKSSQVMSSEVKFDGLLTSMMTIILENSGADFGTIVIKEEKFGICAYGSQQMGQTTTYNPPRPLSEDDDLVSSRIINHTIHTGESIFIPDVEFDTRFAVGPWYERAGKKAVISMPIIHKTTIVGCLLIEGATGIFTQRHITVLSLLCQQMGISITNAFLFKSVQRVTMANMRMIEMQKQALEEAKRSKEAADKATRLREIFLANMSHEIRTPFSGFYGMISLLAETKLDSEQRDLVKTAKESCEILLRIIDDLLNFSKLQAGKVSLDLSPVVVGDVIADVVEMLIVMAIKKRIHVTYTVADDVPSIVLADGNRLRQIIVNLLGNAIKFTHAGEICIRCSIDHKAPEDTSQVPLLFEVIDSGIGISHEQRKALFAPFSQVDGSTTRKYGGTGLGLSICLQLIQLMSGRIDVTSTPDKGSNFYFTIRAGRLDEKAAMQTEPVVQQPHLLPQSSSSILIIDDHPSTLTMAQGLLSHHPLVVADGVFAADDLHAYRASDYTFVMVGLFLPTDPGWSAPLKRFLIHAKRIIFMHYPTSTNHDLLALKQPASVSVDDATTTTRIAVPLRRQKLLLAMQDLMTRGRSSPTALTSFEIAGAVAPAAVADSGQITAKERATFSQMHILAAEDNPVAQKLLFKQLTRLGFKVECANNGLEAIEAWMKQPDGHFAMAFFDHHMPKLDGVEATKRIRNIEQETQRSRLSIIALSADVQQSAREICLDSGMDGYLTKPMSQAILVAALRRYCANS